MQIFNQQDAQFNGWYLGKVKTSSFANFACHLFCWTFMCSVKLGKEINPKEVDKIFTEMGVYNGDLIDSEKAAHVLGLQYFGKEYDVNKAPDWVPNIKEVDYSIANGKQQHFVIRDIENGKKVIKDPLGGVTRSLNYYEKKVKDLDWTKNRHFSYRLVKI